MEPPLNASPATLPRSYSHSTFIYIRATMTFNQGRVDQTNQVPRLPRNRWGLVHRGRSRSAGQYLREIGEISSTADGIVINPFHSELCIPFTALRYFHLPQVYGAVVQRTSLVAGFSWRRSSIWISYLYQSPWIINGNCV